MESKTLSQTPLAKKAQAGNKDSAFAALGLAKTVQAVCEEIRELYQWDEIPWVIGYSGGKDSSAVLQLVWLAIRELPPEKRTKPIHVISGGAAGRGGMGGRVAYENAGGGG
jgi:3'-phosphoadenosine 5'-phosphosulfate sulfotransferase (PAPS reductase)/FAD synthetase